MKKKVLLRALLGAPLGVCITVFNTVLNSLNQNDGAYYAVVPQLIPACGTELNAVLLQLVCSLLYGAVWGGASPIWEAEGWSLLRQTLTHLLACCPATIVIAWLLYWMPHTAQGVLTYLAIFFGIYLFIWLGQYAGMKKRVKQVNDRLDRRRFFRISNSEIINLKKVRGFDLSLSGTICVSLSNGMTTYVSRRYMSKIKQFLGM